LISFAWKMTDWTDKYMELNMTEAMQSGSPANRKAYVITGPTSGIGLRTALELARHGTVVLVGRDSARLDDVKQTIERNRGRAVAVVCDLSDLASVRGATAQIIALRLPIIGLLNNAGISAMRPSRSPQGWDLTFATNHLGPFAFTEALAPFLPDGSNVLFVASAVEDPDRRPAKIVGMRGGRFISVEASVRGEWKPGGSTLPGADAYATSKQCVLATALAFARETPRLRFNAIEPGITPGTRLARHANGFVRFLFSAVITRIPPFARYRSTPKRAARVITRILTDASTGTGVYYDKNGQPMLGSALVREPQFQDRVVAETRALLSGVPLSEGDH
jgi:NAD(P)-dependent dehydrogenase (short-subunit alcohol dehydrogenase family)